MFTDDNVYQCDLDRERLTLNEVIDLYRNVLDGSKTLFIVDDCSSTQEIKYQKKTCTLSKMAFSGRHYNHSRWILRRNTIQCQRTTGRIRPGSLSSIVKIKACLTRR